MDAIRQELNQSADVLDQFIPDEQNIAAIEQAAILITSSFKKGGKVLSCGNRGRCFTKYLTKKFVI